MMLRKIALWLVAAACLIIAAIAIEHRFATPDPMGLDPVTTGELESSMWRSYYEGKWMRLAGETMQMASGQFGYSWWDAARMSWYSARAARHFWTDTTHPGCVPLLTRYYQIIRSGLGTSFEPEEAAELELLWWQQRRQDGSTEEIAETIRQLGAMIHGTEGRLFHEAALKRVKAMEFRDARGEGITNEEWHHISDLLTSAYQSFLEAAAE